jgi:hypothetical protein
MLLYMSPQLAALSLAVIPPVGVVGVLYGKYAKRRQKMVQAALGKTMEVSAGCFLEGGICRGCASRKRPPPPVPFSQRFRLRAARWCGDVVATPGFGGMSSTRRCEGRCLLMEAHNTSMCLRVVVCALGRPRA